MVTSAVICAECQRVVAVGAGLPATCLALVPDEERAKLPPAELERHPLAHRNCIEIEVRTSDSGGATLLGEVARNYAEQIGAMSELFRELRPDVDR